ncbi:SDR family NAD(P)-dependent oxidoreductase [Pseudomonas shirazica]|jgi:3-oxoacyl-[acyl-carrier protein] reductase|uniref:2,3-dihydroxy-2,3-dihydro-p-cumate dehydrogenase n=1 Tax=Pseudomonas monteilii SB3101 TaxID=1435058 RepID=V9UYG3_9PSED|nr:MULTISPECIES: 3-oxoacyl-ACP reductase family protein [Pseudomonas]AHC82318.1 3-oxoacyl-ACP reductase [Pseudomonas monteilii SB3078]AHC87696.1 3-oxoacyl-ACP reductase [Pseudomonas monteilii SB3101]KAF4560475.1 3-oxoacyl-ACP reductase FabG [Pseudomonas sp. CES]KGK25378.1 3-oxoacyl-ACP reductase [Pseudomonas plecoglossicida]KIC83498.1 3-oxoacyl-ACP reductase [Pseudomonas sp. C5pp]
MTQKIAVVTGGSRGIGKSVVLALAGAGYQVAFSYVRDEASAAALQAQVEGLGRECLAVQCDVKDAQSIQAFFERVEQRFERIDLLVNNAGITRDGLLAAQSLSDITEVIQTNLIGTLLCCQQVLPCMMRQRSGCIVNLSSVAAQKPGKGQSNYAAAKGGVEALTRALAVELAPRNIRVNAVAPGIVSTDMSEALVGAHEQEIQSRLLIKRFARPEEIADAVLYLAERGLYVTGEVLPVNGGLKML